MSNVEEGAEELYPDDLYGIIYAHENPEVTIDSRFVFLITPDDVARTIPGFYKFTTTNPFSGTDFITSYEYVQNAANLYPDVAPDTLLDLILPHLKPYTTDQVVIRQTFILAFAGTDLDILAGPKLSSEEKRRIRDDVTVARDNEWAKSQGRINFLDEVFDFASGEAASPEGVRTSVITVTKSDVSYQYPNNEATERLFTITDIPLNQSLTFAANISEDELTGEDLFGSKIYDRARDLDKLLGSIAEYRKKEVGFHLSFYDGDDYRTGIYSPITHRLVIPSTHSAVFTNVVPPDLLPYGESEVNLTVTWTLYRCGIVLELLLHAIMTDTLLRRYLSIDETAAPYSLRLNKNIVFYYPYSADDRRAFEVTISSQRLHSETEIEILDLSGTVRKEKMAAKTRYLNFSVGKVSNREQADGIRYLLNYLITYFKRNLQKDLMQFYKASFPTWKPNYTIVSSAGTGGSGGTLISKLQSINKDIFPKGYARLCLGDRQVDVVTPEEETLLEEEARAQGRPFSSFEFPRKGDRKAGEQVLILTCPSTDNPYVGFRRNYFLSNSKRYPYLPCCYAKDQDKPGTGYRIYMGIEEEIDSIATLTKKNRGKAGKELLKVDRLLKFSQKRSIP